MSNRVELDLEAMEMVSGGNMYMKCLDGSVAGTLWIGGHQDKKYKFLNRDEVVKKYKEVHRDHSDEDTLQILIKEGLVWE